MTGGRNIGTLQFLAAIPFHLINTEILWDCYALITKWASSEKDGVASEDISSEFENELISMNESDAFYLLNTLSNMAIAREGQEPDFVRVVTFHLFQIGFISPVTRDTCSKHARDLLGALTKKYPNLISVLLDIVKTKMEILNSIALLVFEAYTRWMKNQTLLSESMKQVSSLAGKNQDNYSAWTWDIITKLHLHIYDRSNNGVRLATMLRTLPTFESHPELEQLRAGVSEKNASDYSAGSFNTCACPHGIEQLEVLVLNYKYEAILHALFFLTSIFVGCREALCRNEKFRAVLSSILAADMTYMRMAKNLIKYDFPGYYTKMFGDMVSSQIQQYDRLQTTPTALIKLWIDCLTKLENWNKDRNALHVLNILAKYCFTRDEWQSCFLEHFNSVYKELSTTPQSGIASFLFSWSSPVKTLLPTPFYSSSPYFTYGILTIETNLENETGFWNSVMTSLANPKTSLDAAVKKACSSSKFTTSPNFLTIYRWAQFALELPVDHKLTFLLIFNLCPNSDSNQGVGVGERFFEGMVNTAFAKKLKARLHETLEHYRNSLGTMEMLTLEENASENPAVMMDYYKECVSVATAFTLWIDDPQMHSTSLYLPALPPQFLPLRLLSVMEGCQIEWKEFINQDEIEASVKSIGACYAALICRSGWYEGTRRRRVQSSTTYDDRQDEILRRLATYDQPLDPPPAPIFEKILPMIPGVMLLEPKSMLNGIAKHFKSLTDYAQLFSLQISQQTALDCSYCESIPDLYNNFPAEALVNVRCGGTKKWGSCSGPAHVLFKYTEARLNESVGRRIHQNRTDYEGLLNEKLLQPPPMNVCVAAVLLEDVITTLIVSFRSFPENHPDYTRTCSVGAELFYHLIEQIKDETNFYPPTRQLFTSSAEVLGREFISPDSSQYKRLVNSCVVKPHLIGVLAPNINLGLCSTTSLIEIYKDVTNIPKKDADLAFVILTKFDMSSWLRKTKPKLFERSQLISYIWKAIISEGFDPEQSTMVYDVFRSHFRVMLLYDFPQHYGEILNYLLEGSEAQSVPLMIWFDFFNCLSRNAIKFKTGMDSALKRRDIKRFATEANIIHYQELIETARLLAGHFTKERLSYGIYGLYPKYRNYIEAISCFMQLISVSVVASTLKNSKGSLSQKIVESIWPVLHDLYAPWILPYNQKMIQQQCAQWIQQMNFDSSSVLHPWVANDSSYAIIFMNDFTDCLMFLVETLPGTGSLFSCLWGFYVENYASSGVKPHVLGVVHNCLVSVPWTIFWPNFSDVETMNRVVEKYLPSCHSFLAVIFAQVNWLEWIKHLNPSMISKGFGILLNLTVRLANDSIARESPSWVCVMERALCQMSWETVLPSSLEPILNWFVMSIDPRVVLNLENGHHMDKAVLKLLKLASGFTIPDIPVASTGSVSRHNRIDVPSKRYLFVRSYIRLLVTASSKFKQMLGTHSKNFEESIQLLMDDVVAVIRNENTPPDEFLPQLQELVSLMSNHYLGTVARNALIEWCNSRRNAPLPVLYALIQLSFSAKVPAYVIVPLVETAMSLCFAHPGATWANLCEVSTLNPDEREVASYFEVSSKDGHFLKRHKLICYGGINSITFLSDVLKNLKPRESNEEVMPLIYGNMIKCSVSILQQSGASQSNDAVTKCIKKFLNALAQHLSLFADDKQSWGLLGALGLGKVSQLTVKGRLFARCLSVFILSQIPSNGDIRMKGVSAPASSTESAGSPSHVKPHSEFSSAMEKLVSLKINRQYATFEEPIDFAVEFVENPSHSLGNADLFIKQLNEFLFTGRHLFELS
ncbi:Ectopic P granules protein 5 [Orchesella cincta]|uniref:Ectopic P granules protein 5 n=1 Tax=Orchesella cincta TaxID=48709 RepID=A0A1D2MF85_ORCCI|nr:Ectopic P granules protein 5 [Orchesella cincta]